jgi:hypothetical protein
MHSEMNWFRSGQIQKTWYVLSAELHSYLLLPCELKCVHITASEVFFVYTHECMILLKQMCKTKTCESSLII